MQRKKIHIVWIAILCVFAAALITLSIYYWITLEQEREKTALFSITVEEIETDHTPTLISISTEEVEIDRAPTIDELASSDDAQYQAYKIFYKNVTNVILKYSDRSIELRDAIKQETVTASQLIAKAEADAVQGICSMKVESGAGQLTLIGYWYPGYTMGVVNDMYSAPNGEEYIFRYIMFGPANQKIGTPTMLKEEDGAFIRADQENWGVTLAEQAVTAAGMTLHCAQSDVRLDGDLYLGDIYIISRKMETGWEILEMPENHEFLSAEEVIARNQRIPEGEEAVYDVSWEETYGLLESGTYTVWLYIYKDNSVGDNFIMDGQKQKVRITVP